MRLLFMSLAIVLIVGMALLSARIWGLSVTHQRYDHPFLTEPLIAVRVDTLMDARRVVAAHPDAILWLDVHEMGDRHFLVSRNEPLREFLVEKSFAPGKYRGPNVTNYALEDLRPLFPQAPLLTELMTEFPRQRFILNIVDNVQNVDRDLVAELEPLEPDKRVLIQSDTDVLIRSVKELKPLWIYGTSWPDLMKLMSFESIGLVAAAPYRGDVFISPLKIMNRAAFNEGVLTEARRRNKTILVGPLTSADEVQRAREAHPNGLILDRAELWPATAP